MSNESVPSKLGKNFSNKHSYLQNKPTSYFKRMSEQLKQTANSFKSIVVTISDKAQIASYQVSELIVQNTKSHTLGESIILPGCKKTVSTMLGNECSALKISTIPLSYDTVRRRILEMSSDIEKNVSGNKFQYSDFVLQGYESTNITNKAQLIAFVRFINKNEIANQSLFCKELSVTTKGEDIFLRNSPRYLISFTNRILKSTSITLGLIFN